MSDYTLTGEFTVKEARNRGTIPNPHGGELVKWYVDFIDSNGQPVTDARGAVSDCYWQRKPESDVTPGDTVYGVITEGDYGLRFKKLQRPDGHESSAGARPAKGSGAKSWEPESQRDPERSARITRQHSQSAAIAYATLMQSQGLLPEAFGPDALKTLIDWFDLDATEAGRAVLT